MGRPPTRDRTTNPQVKYGGQGLGLGVNALVVFVQRVECLMGGMYPQVK